MNKNPLLVVKNLSVSFGSKTETQQVVHDLSFTIQENKILGIVGESGSGKSVSSLAIMGLLPKKNATCTGEIWFNDKNVLMLSNKEVRTLRGKEIAMIFQEPMSALNPSMKCGKQVSEMIKLHLNVTSANAKKETISLFNKVKLPRPESIYNSYPHQISGGQMQRVMIAMALSCKPKLLIADEPTTALDVTVQKEIIQLLKTLQQETKMSMLFISHDLGLVSEIADEVLVMYQGKKVEQGSVVQVFKNPTQKYTQALLESRPKLDVRLKKLPTIQSITENTFSPKIITPQDRAIRHKKLYTQAPLLEVTHIKKIYDIKVGFFGKKKSLAAVNDVSFSVYEGETLGLVGESGCGKSTLGKTILQLEKASAGSIKYRGKELTQLTENQMRNFRKEIQLIFQDPYASLNPRILIGHAIKEPMKVHNIGKNETERILKVKEILVAVGLDEKYYYRYPHELSGGQRQRVGIARTIALNPKLIICDESVSALDISVQAQVLNLLNDLKETYGFTYIFISHDLAVVKFMADQLVVMNNGKFEEVGDADEIYANPHKAYTKKLIEAIPKGI
jgi:peptide/nickel transport system ATP-binding protein